MRKVILQEFVTLDGLAAGPNDSVDFIPASNAGDQSFAKNQMAFIDSIDAMLLGRVTYEMFAGYWPNVTSGDDKPFADRLNAMPKIVFSRTLKRASWGKWDNVTIVKNDPAKEVVTLKQGAGKNMVMWGSISVAQSLMSERLINEYQLVVCPVVLGSGKPLFPDKKSLDMKLLKTKSFDRGAVLLAYTATTHARPHDQE
jgi:dihydrofolate reductase